jgi:hypothetical protein
MDIDELIDDILVYLSYDLFRSIKHEAVCLCPTGITSERHETSLPQYHDRRFWPQPRFLFYCPWRQILCREAS